MNNLPAPFAPLVAGGDGLDRYPAEPRALAARMAQIYGLPADSVLPVRGLTHGLELVFRLTARDGQRPSGVWARAGVTAARASAAEPARSTWRLEVMRGSPCGVIGPAAGCRGARCC